MWDVIAITSLAPLLARVMLCLVHALGTESLRAPGLAGVQRALSLPAGLLTLARVTAVQR